jgi:hypothetical protein
MASFSASLIALHALQYGCNPSGLHAFLWNMSAVFTARQALQRFVVGCRLTRSAVVSLAAW